MIKNCHEHLQTYRTEHRARFLTIIIIAKLKVINTSQELYITLIISIFYYNVMDIFYFSSSSFIQFLYLPLIHAFHIKFIFVYKYLLNNLFGSCIRRYNHSRLFLCIHIGALLIFSA